MSSAAAAQRDHQTAKDKKTADNTTPALPRANEVRMVKHFTAMFLKKGENGGTYGRPIASSRVRAEGAMIVRLFGIG